MYMCIGSQKCINGCGIAANRSSARRERHTKTAPLVNNYSYTTYLDQSWAKIILNAYIRN